MNTHNTELDLYLNEKEQSLMNICVRSKFIISESDVGAKHFSLLDSDIDNFSDFIVSTQWTVTKPKRGRVDLVVVKKWKENYPHRKKCYAKNLPYYEAEYKIDDEPGRYGKGHQANDFKNDVVRLSEHCSYLQRAFALYYYRGPIQFEGNVFDIKSPDYLFRNTDSINYKDKLNVYFVDLFGIHRLQLL